MKRPAFFLLLLIPLFFIYAFNSAEAPSPEGKDWESLVQGKLVTVLVRKELYQMKDEPHVFYRVRVQNIAGRPLAVDFSDRYDLVRPTQWQISDEDHRQVIDQMMLEIDALTDEQKAALKANFKAGKLAKIAPFDYAEYYVEFDGMKKSELGQFDGAYLLTAFDGELAITDGQEVEHLHPDAENKVWKSEVVMERPFSWSVVPMNGTIIRF